LRKPKPSRNPSPPEAAKPPPASPPPKWTRMPPMPPSAAILGNLDPTDRQRLRDQHDLDQQSWEREQRQAQMIEAQRHDFGLIINAVMAAEREAKRALRLAQQKANGAEAGAKAKRGRKPSPLSVAVAAEAERRRLAKNPRELPDAPSLLKWMKRKFTKAQLAENKFGQNAESDGHKIRRWISPKRT
jgi:hypothetical protein